MVTQLSEPPLSTFTVVRPPTLTRIDGLLDEDSPSVLPESEEVAVTVARGRIGGSPVIVFCTDHTKKGGALGAAECARITSATDLALAEGVPVIGLWHSAGAKLTDGVEAMHGIGGIFAAMVRASGKIPQISVVLGPAAGGAAYGPGLTDLVIMAPAARIFITGPDVVRAVTGEEIDMTGLGGPDAHGNRSGVAHVTAKSEAGALASARRLVGLLTRRGGFDVAASGPPTDLRALLPESRRRAYDVRPLLRKILDGDGDPEAFEELQPRWAPNMVVGFGRIGGGTVGVVASNPLRKGGCLDSRSAEKAARFVRFCDSLGVPLLVLVDVPGYLPGVRQEWDGVVRRGAKLLYAFAEARVPRITLVTRKSYGGAYIAMNSRSLGATAVFAWPDAEVDVMSADAAVSVLHRKLLAATPDDEREALRQRLITEHEATTSGVQRGIASGTIDEIVEPSDTRLRLIRAFASAPAGRGDHGNIPL